MKRNITLFCTLLVTSILLMPACNNAPSGQQTGTHADTARKVQVQVPDLDADSAYAYVANQVAFGPRVPNSAGHKKCGDYLVNTLKQFADTVIEQHGLVTTFSKVNIDLRNIIASFNPGNPNRVLLCAHWDTRPFADQDSVNKGKPILGANDGGSGVGVLLEVARQLHLHKPDIGVDIVFFDAEDWGAPMGDGADTYCLGSQFWSKTPHTPGYSARFGILLDMVGAKDAQFAMEEVSVTFAKSVLDKVWGAAHQIGYGKHFLYYNKGGITDDHLYINRNLAIPTIDIIQYDIKTRSGFGHYWHTHKDNMDVIDAQTLKAVGQTLLQVIYTES